ncbi:Cytochrome P450 [Nostoc flagelliforme CCNUN1]|uniref:Cytochrome P450 n=1 Tax=Nostoc flagelliforme CCNUN1 TaxID=2038116 RepID=A0A2K8SIZ0_9NOSO|nr:cytochrome P450 [Nostoc flagelliforme]AUB35401.1 Cytochrome P450 [Nostoc flagelliforme CCNUN1]
MLTKEIPVAKGLPLIGNLVFLSKNNRKFEQFCIENYRKLGPLYKACVLGKEFKIFAGPEANMFVTQQGIHHLTTREAFMVMEKEFGENTIMVLDGDSHRRSRKIVDQFLNAAAIAQYVNPMIQVTLNFIKDWQIGQRIELFHAALPKIILNQLSSALLSCTLTDDFVEDIYICISTLLKVTSEQKGESALRKPTYLKVKNRMLTFVKQLVDERRKTGQVTDSPDVVDFLLSVKDDDGQLLTEEEIFSYIPIIIAAGLDTVAHTSAFLIYEILKHPEIYQQVMAEVSAVFDNRIPDLEDMKNMKVLRGAAMETLRLHPVVFMTQRYVQHPFDYQDYRVESGQIMYFASGVSHFLPELFPNPYTFDVERYAPPREEHKQPGAFAPFFLGPHRCAGARLAEIQLMLTAATILYTVQPQLDPPNYTMKTALYTEESPTLAVKGNFYIKTRRKIPLSSLA